MIFFVKMLSSGTEKYWKKWGGDGLFGAAEGAWKGVFTAGYPRNPFKVSTPHGDKHQPAAQYPLPTSKAVRKMTCHIEYEVEKEAATGFFESICEDSQSPFEYNNLDTSSISDTGHWANNNYFKY